MAHEHARALLKNWRGLSRGRTLASFPKRRLDEGAAVELEHAGGYLPLARRIAADHLVEDKDYYRKLAKLGIASGYAPEPWYMPHAEVKYRRAIEYARWRTTLERALRLATEPSDRAFLRAMIAAEKRRIDTRDWRVPTSVSRLLFAPSSKF